MTDAELIERMNRRGPATARLLGTRILAIDRDAGTVRMSFEPRPEFCNPMGNVQGGFVTAMLDDCAAIAAIIAAGRRIVVPTIELKTSFFGVVPLGRPVFGTGRCLKLGRRVAFMEAELADADGRLLAKLSTSAIPTPMPDDAVLVEQA